MKAIFKKSYNLKMKSYFKDNNFFYICNGTSLSFKSQIAIEQDFLKLNLKCYKINNKLTVRLIKTSIYKNISLMINGLTIFVGITKDQATISRISDSRSQTLIPLGIRFNNKIYSTTQLKNLTKFDYKIEIVLLHKTLKTLLKNSYIRLRKTNISK